ncbi:MAG TPA: threonine synthase [Rhodothermales bacterium]|nr:threonine synthase [Bacteroidota bacterium]HRK73049.1 threonine synthase [Rhodothermales bacterium]HRR09394.1 threonine synthase [Rhodothermales bacterium]
MNPTTFKSTRTDTRSFRFSEALLQGLSEDGGLFIPEAIPDLPVGWRDQTAFNELGLLVLRNWLGNELPEADLASLVTDALNFPVPVVRLQDSAYLGEQTAVLELTHGPTLSFKDFGARTMARLMAYFLSKQGRKLTILVATSGDTGSAVADGFSGLDGIEVVLLYPKGQVSPVQEMQLVVSRPGVRSFAVEGTFDDCQRMVKEAFMDPVLAHLPLSSANSINIGRLLPQSLYYIWAYLQMDCPVINFCVPSGNLGNLTGGLFACEGGLPVNQFVVAHNANNFFPTYLETHQANYKPSVRTVSNAMDVGVPSNFERLQSLFTPQGLNDRLWATSVSDEETTATMQRVYQETGYMACPHTAVGLEAVHRYRRETGDHTPIVVLSTAHPAKFPEVVGSALQVEPPKAEALELLKSRTFTHYTLSKTLEALREVLLKKPHDT